MSKMRNCVLVCALLVISCMCVFHLPSEGHQSILFVSFEPTAIETECNRIHDQSTVSSENPIPNQEYVWGWNGNLSFEYWNDTLNQGIENATVQYWWVYGTGFANEIGNGTYAIPIDTRRTMPGGLYPLTILASKSGHEPLNDVVIIIIHEVPTELVVYSPIQNQNGWPLDLLVPYGDSINITLFYNDTDSSDGYVGGIPDAESICQIGGPTLPMSDYPVTDIGNGNYSIHIDSLDPNLYATTGGEPVLSPTPYTLYALLHSQNRSICDIALRISIITIPTEVELPYPDSLIVLEGYTFDLGLQYTDIWHDSSISEASVSVDLRDSDILRLVTNLNESETDPGLYTIIFQAIKPGNAVVTITIEKDFHESCVHMFFVLVEPFREWLPPPPTPGLSIIVIAIIVYALYRRSINAPNENDTLAQ